MIKAGIMGATGYVGLELMRILNSHVKVEIKKITSVSYSNESYAKVFESFRHMPELVCGESDIEALAEECDVVFLALPHGLASKQVTEDILKKTKIIDMGADFRLKDYAVYEEWYQVEHFGKGLLEEAVYGLVELNREKIKGARLIANPGCYTTCSILALYPLVAEGIIKEDSIVIDAKSGVSGAGRGVNLGMHFCEVNENFKAYKIAGHRHTPEIEEQLSYGAGKNIVLQFTPHLVPMNRGILATSYASLKKPVDFKEVKAVYEKYYGDEFFVRLCKENVFPETKWVVGSNFCDIGFAIDQRTNRIVVVSALDNLCKGAATQAVQNMNLLFGLEEKTGIDYIPVFPA